jgi:1-acyl-sn-glycerol-3-phosphate acyltransferase
MLFRMFVVRPAFYLFYRKIDIIGAETVPDRGPVIFTPNHQNALMDALAILCTKDRQPVFMARADIFQKPFIVKILHFLRILPVFRKRDGGNSSDNNQETFDIILKVLHSQQSVGIMPEGIHNEIKHLRMLQKGVFRLAMQVQQDYGDTPAVKIVPVGLEYTDTRKFRSRLIVNYGRAIEASDYYGLFAQNSAKAYKAMQDTLSEKMKEGMIHISSEEFYSGIERIRVFYGNRAAQLFGLNPEKASDRLKAQQKTIAALEKFAEESHDEMKVLAEEIQEYTGTVRKLNIRDWVVEKQPYSLAGLCLRSLLILVGTPFFILGMLFNYLPYKLAGTGSRTVKDPQFISSVQYVLGIIFCPAYHLALTVLFLVFIPCIWGKIVMILLLVPSGLFAYRFHVSCKKLNARFRFLRGMSRKDRDICRVIELRKSIFSKMDGIIGKAVDS